MNRRGALFMVLALASVGIAAGIGGSLWLHQRQLQQQALERQTAPRAATATDSANASSAPLFGASLTDLQGRPVALAAWRGKPLVVNFWASWCPPCVAEMPEIADFYRQRRRKELEVVGIALDQPDAVRAFLRQHPVPYPILLGGMSGDALSRQLGDTIDALPYTVVIAADGRIVWQHPGRLDLDELTAHLP